MNTILQVLLRNPLVATCRQMSFQIAECRGEEELRSEGDEQDYASNAPVCISCEFKKLYEAATLM